MCLVNQSLRRFFVHAGDADVHLDFDTETSRNLADTHGGVYAGVGRQHNLLCTGDKFHGTQEASAVARSKQLLGVDTTSRATHFFGYCQFHIQKAVRCAGGSITAARRFGMGLVNYFFNLGSHGGSFRGYCGCSGLNMLQAVAQVY